MSCGGALSAARMRAASAGAPMKARRSLLIGGRLRRLGGNGRLQAFRFRELAQDDAALQRGDMVDEKHTLEMVDLVLDAGREQAPGFPFADLAMLVEIAQADFRRALDLGILLGQRQAALVADDALLRPPENLGIGDPERRGLAAL